MRPQRIVFYLFLCIALYLTTIAAVVFLPAASTPGGTPNGQLAEAVRLIVIPTACIAWISTAVTLVADRRTRRTMRELGYDEQVYKLMLQMRGAGSRLALLTSLRSPKHRSSLAQPRISRSDG